MTNNRNALTHWNPGMKRGIIVMVCLLVGLKAIDALVQENEILAPSWKWSLIAGLCGGVYVAVVNAYQAGLNSKQESEQKGV